MGKHAKDVDVDTPGLLFQIIQCVGILDEGIVKESKGVVG